MAIAPTAGTTGADPTSHLVHVVGPTHLLHSGNATVEDATALSVLQGLATAAGFSVVVDDLPGCAQDYVRSVAGHGETGTGGWNYYTRNEPGDGWDWQPTSAACHALRPHDAVLWCWVEPDERCAVYP